MTQVSTLVVAQLLFLEADNPKKEIAFYINSPGGVVFLPVWPCTTPCATSGQACLDHVRRHGGLNGLASS